MSDNVATAGETVTIPGTAVSAPSAEAPRKSKAPWIILAVVLILGIAAGAWYYMAPGQLTSPAKRVGSIDQEVIFSLDEFKKASEELEKFSTAKQKEFDKQVKEKAGKAGADAELQNTYRKLQLEISQKRNQLLNPLQNRAEASVASVARSKGLTVVVDKRIVVYGIPDITEDVKKVFQQSGELTLPPEVDTSTSPIAYFDQNVVRSLKVFTEAEIKIAQYRNEMMRDYEKRAAKLSAAEQEALQREMSARLEALQEQMLTPLYQKVTNSVNTVSKGQGISLVLDKQNVMYGGRNITDSVIETFLSSVSPAQDGEGAKDAGKAQAAPAQSKK